MPDTPAPQTPVEPPIPQLNYEAVPDFSQPPGQIFVEAAGVAVNFREHIYIFNRRKPPQWNSIHPESLFAALPMLPKMAESKRKNESRMKTHGFVFLAPMGLTICASLLYHVTQKMIPRAINPFLSLVITFSTAALLCLIAFLFMSRLNSEALANLNWASVALGFAVLGIDFGYLLAYRTGWRINKASVVCNVSVALMLVPIGYLLYREGLSRQSVAGICLCVVGLFLLIG